MRIQPKTLDESSNQSGALNGNVRRRGRSTFSVLEGLVPSKFLTRRHRLLGVTEELDIMHRTILNKTVLCCKLICVVYEYIALPAFLRIRVTANHTF